jgi:hypothetical protein
VFGEDEVAVDRDVEGAGATLDDLRAEAEALLDRIRQTGGSREVVSDDAVLDRDLGHGAPPTMAEYTGGPGDGGRLGYDAGRLLGDR